MTRGQSLTTRVIEDGAARIELDAAELRVVAGPDRGLKVRLGTDSLRIGTAVECEIVLHDPTISSRHAEVFADRHGYAIRDLGSKNGIQLGPYRIERAPLADHMKLRLGESTLQVVGLGGSTSVPLARAQTFGDLVAHSIKMRAVVAVLEQLALSDITVLVEGESGTGKEVVARSLHAKSTRAHAPFVVFDCAAVAPSVMASELFGHARGAFTGATSARAGVLEEADGGTLFLDEIGEMPLDLQPMLLGALARKRSRPVGGDREHEHDVRIVAATNRNLAEEVRHKRFREDLYHRLAVARVRLPALRERPEDLRALVHRFAAEQGLAITPELVGLLAAYDWPGNVRELQNTIAQLAVQPDAAARLVPGRPHRPFTFDFGGEATLAPLHEARRQSQDELERAYLVDALRRCGGNLTQAAELAGISRQMITRLAAKHGLRGRDRDE